MESSSSYGVIPPMVGSGMTKFTKISHKVKCAHVHVFVKLHGNVAEFNMYFGAGLKTFHNKR